MTRPDPPTSHQLLDVDRYGVLRIPASFWLCMAFLSRYWLLLVLIAASWMGPSGNISWAYEMLSWPMLWVESPMLLLAVVALRRAPTAGRWDRILWRRGRAMVAVTVALSAGWAVGCLSAQDVWSPVPERLFAVLALADVGIAAVIWRSPLYKALFDEFPIAANQKPIS